MTTHRTGVGPFILVLVLTASALRIADTIPRVLTGLPPGVVRVDSLGELARLQADGLTLPSYHPAQLEWPPRELRVAGPHAAAITAARRDGGDPWMTLASAPTDEALAASRLLPPAAVLQDTDMTIGALPARVQRLQDEQGAVWHQVQWHTATRAHVVRYRGPLDELLRIAASCQTGNGR